MAESTIITGQYVRISQTAAGLGERFLARLIDFIIICIYCIATVYLTLGLSMTIDSDPAALTTYFILLLPVLLYDPLCETFHHGQSPGKQLMGIRVVMLDGSTPSMSAYLIRWLLFVVDVPLTSGIGAIFILMTDHNQRIGDLAAGTMVIKLDNYRKVKVSLNEYNYLSENYKPMYKEAMDLSFEQAAIIEKVLAVHDTNRNKYTSDLGKKLKHALGVTPVEPTYEAFLETVLHDFQYYAYVDV